MEQRSLEGKIFRSLDVKSIKDFGCGIISGEERGLSVTLKELDLSYFKLMSFHINVAFFMQFGIVLVL
jgi:hypothetical protein